MARCCAWPIALVGPTTVRQNAAGDLLWVDNQTSRLWFQPVAGGTSFGQPILGGRAYLIAGAGQISGPAEGWPAIFAALAPRDVRFGPGGTIYVSDGVARKVWQIDSAGVLSTFAGSSVSGRAGNGPGRQPHSHRRRWDHPTFWRQSDRGAGPIGRWRSADIRPPEFTDGDHHRRSGPHPHRRSRQHTHPHDPGDHRDPLWRAHVAGTINAAVENISPLNVSVDGAGTSSSPMCSCPVWSRWQATSSAWLAG